MNAESNVTIECPHCRSTDTELASPFGQQLMTSQYYCRACGTPFERVRGDDVLNDIAHAMHEDSSYS